MNLRRVLKARFRREKTSRRLAQAEVRKGHAAETEAEKMREIEQLIQAGIAANKFPPR